MQVRRQLIEKGRCLSGVEGKEDALHVGIHQGGRGVRKRFRETFLVVEQDTGRHDLAAKALERIAERVHKTRNVGVVNVHGSHLRQFQPVVGESGSRSPGVEVVVGEAEIAGVVVGVLVAFEIRRERGRGVGRRDHHQPRFTEQHGGRRARARA